MVEWTWSAEQLPTQADADEQNCVLVWHELSGVMVTGWHRVQENRLMVAWARTPKGPERSKA